ncbi:hypothetical protein [uncultured Acinetobacter sp.]|uniref:hypothetical protein n=1 Tax=uncultured Acinetobacter sp. TaxID=165433 RepID=UPI00258E2B80|nr:hypothetical protein [uncultured Acinetobacter sp.]
MKLSTLPEKIPKKYAVLFISIPIILAFLLPNSWIPVLMFFIFCPFILLLIWTLIYSIAKPYQHYYPAEYQEWFKETPSTFSRSSSYSSSSQVHRAIAHLPLAPVHHRVAVEVLEVVQGVEAHQALGNR